MRKIYTKTFVYFAEIQYIYNEINNRNIIMDILNFTYYFLIYKVVFQKVCLGRRLQILQICKYSDSCFQIHTPRRVDLIFVL